MPLKKKLIFLLSMLFIVLAVTAFKRHGVDGLNGIGLAHALAMYYIFFYVVFAVAKLLLHFLKTNKNLYGKLQLAGVSLFAILVLAEVILRLAGINATYFEKKHKRYNPSNHMPPASYYLTDNFQPFITEAHGEFVFFRTYNSLGLAEREMPLQKDSGVFRILALGDSFTEGAGAPYDSTWVKLLEWELNRHFTYLQIEVINAGIIGSDPFYSYVHFRDKLHVYEPDLLLMAVNTTDVSDYIFRGGMSRFQADGSVKYNPPPMWEPLYAYSYLSRLFFHNLLGYDYHFIKSAQHIELADKAIKEMIETARLFSQAINGHKHKTLVVLHPQRGEALQGAYFYPEFSSFFMNDSQLSVIDILPFLSTHLKSCTVPDAYYWPIDGHHTPEGYALFAEAVLQGILSKNLIHVKEAGK